jgi:hypothetical protein
MTKTSLLNSTAIRPDVGWPAPGRPARPMSDGEICTEKGLSNTQLRRLRKKGLMPQPFKFGGSRSNRTMSDVVDDAVAAIIARQEVLPNS